MFNRMPRLQPFESQFLEMKLVSKLGNIASNPWEFIILAKRTTKFWCFKLEDTISTFGNGNSVELGTHGSNRGKLVPIFGDRRFPELAICGCKISKFWGQRFGPGNSQNWNPIVPSLGRIDSTLWEPAVFWIGNARFQDWEAWVPTFEKR